MSRPLSRYLILDSNVWVSEALLKTTMGEALILALGVEGITLGMPEIVEIELKEVLSKLGKKAIIDVKKNNLFLQRLSTKTIAAPCVNENDIEQGVEARLRDLRGNCEVVPFIFQHSQAALKRIILSLPPCGPNNEQFRDCCIWEAALDLGQKGSVDIISGDKAFFEGSTYTNGLAQNLKQESVEKNLNIQVHSNISAFLSTLSNIRTLMKKSNIEKQVAIAVEPLAKEYVESNGFQLGELIKIEAKGFATPQPTLLAVSFVAVYDLRDKSFPDRGAFMDLEGTASYDSKNQTVCEILPHIWGLSLKSYGGRWDIMQREKEKNSKST